MRNRLNFNFHYSTYLSNQNQRPNQHHRRVRARCSICRRENSCNEKERAMSKSDALESDLLKLLFQATPIANIADNAAASPLTNLYIALHTADPGDTGNQSTNEATYTGYARIPVLRTSAGFTLSGTSPTQIANSSTITFGQCTAGSSTVTFFSIGVAVSGATKILYSGALTASLAISNGITPSFSAGQLVCTED